MACTPSSCRGKTPRQAQVPRTSGRSYSTASARGAAAALAFRVVARGPWLVAAVDIDGCTTGSARGSIFPYCGRESRVPGRSRRAGVIADVDAPPSLLAAPLGILKSDGGARAPVTVRRAHDDEDDRRDEDPDEGGCTRLTVPLLLTPRHQERSHDRRVPAQHRDRARRRRRRSREVTRRRTIEDVFQYRK